MLVKRGDGKDNLLYSLCGVAERILAYRIPSQCGRGVKATNRLYPSACVNC